MEETKNKSPREKLIFDTLTFSMQETSKTEGITMEEIFQIVKSNKTFYNLMMYFSGIMCEIQKKQIEDLLPEDIVKLYLQSVKNPVGEFKEKQ
jgi:hypothetical protein